MAAPSDRQRVTASILDRLLDDQPQVPRESPFASRFDLGRHKLAVARDLEALLNSRSTDPGQDDRFPLAAASFLHFGIPDLSGLSLLNPDHRTLLRDRIRSAIERFEPRLAGVRIDLEPPRDNNRVLRFRVEAVLKVHPSQPPVVFDAVLKLSSNTCQVWSQS